MATDTALIEKREELKRRLDAVEYKTMVDIFLGRFNLLLGRDNRLAKSFPLWPMTLLLNIAVSAISFAVIYVAGDWTNMLKYFKMLELSYGFGILWIILNASLAISALIVINQCVNRIIALWRKQVLDLTESIESLHEFTYWLEQACNWRLHLLVTGVGGILISLFLVRVISAGIGTFVGYGFTFMMLILFIFYPAALYLFWVVILLAARLRRYSLRLFVADPASSEIITRLSRELGFVLYMVALYAAIFAFITDLTGGFRFLWVRFIEVLAVWLPLVAMFILNQTGLSAIIRRTKLNTLHRIQVRVDTLQPTKKFNNLENLEAINRLLDYHDRVKATRNSAIDLNTTLNFINSLLLPLLAFLLGNLDKLIALLPK